MKKKLDLNAIQVKSFVTSMKDTGEEQTIKGGTLLVGCVAATTDCLDTRVAAICNGWYSMPFWPGCGGPIGF